MKTPVTMKISYWFSCPKFTVRLETNKDGIITWGAPIIKRFIGQPLANLERWQNAKAIPLWP